MCHGLSNNSIRDIRCSFLPLALINTDHLTRYYVFIFDIYFPIFLLHLFLSPRNHHSFFSSPFLAFYVMQTIWPLSSGRITYFLKWSNQLVYNEIHFRWNLYIFFLSLSYFFFQQLSSWKVDRPGWNIIPLNLINW